MSGPKLETHQDDILLGYIQPLAFGDASTVQARYVQTRSDEHLILSSGNPGPPYRSSAPFHVAKQYVTLGSVNVHIIAPLGRWYTGEVCNAAYTGWGAPSFLPPPSSNEEILFGTRGYDQYKPGKAILDVGQTVAELKEFLRLRSSNHSASQKWANGTLDQAFGLGPLARDFKTMYFLRENLARTMKQLRRDNGKSVRREGRVTGGVISDTTESTQSIIHGLGVFPSFPFDFCDDVWTMTETSTTTTNWKFSAKFKYWVPDFAGTDENYWPPRVVSNLLGTTPNIKLLYNLTPWTWLLDWGTSLGATVSNFSNNAADGLVSEYAYIMRENAEVRHNNVHAKFANDPAWYEISSSVHRITKTRVGAAPYGFGLDPNWLTPARASILGALGINKFHLP